MKESIGITWIFVICLTFIILFTAYVGISVNYAKAFKIKSYIVSQIEENSGISGLDEELNTYLTAQGYVAYGECPGHIVVDDKETEWTFVTGLGNAPAGKHGVCIFKRTVKTGNDDIEAERSYYRVTTFFNFDLPVVNVLIPSIRISGDSQYIYDFNKE